MPDFNKISKNADNVAITILATRHNYKAQEMHDILNGEIEGDLTPEEKTDLLKEKKVIKKEVYADMFEREKVKLLGTNTQELEKSTKSILKMTTYIQYLEEKLGKTNEEVDMLTTKLGKTNEKLEILTEVIGKLISTLENR